MNGLSKLLKEGTKNNSWWNHSFKGSDLIENFRWVCGTFCFLWINFFVAILPPVALLTFFKGDYWEAGGELVFALLAVYANKAILR